MSRAREELILVGILGVGAFVRLYRIDLTWYFLDQVRDVSTASSIAAGQSLPLLGPAVGWTHGHLGPLYFYLIAIPFLFTRDPLGAVVFVALANVLTLALLYRFAKRFFGVSVALSASALFSVFPLAVISSRVLWNPALVPLFTLLFMRALYAVIVDGHSRAIVGMLAAFSVLTQLHLSTVALALVAVLGLLMFRPRVRLADAALAVGLFALLYVPYLLYEVSHRFENLRVFLSATASSDQGPPGGARALPGLVRNLAILFQPALDGFVVVEPWAPWFKSVFSKLYAVEAGLFALGVGLGVYALLSGVRSGTKETPSRRAFALLFLWIAIPVLFLGTRKTALWWYYLDLLYPSQFIFAGIALSFLSARPLRFPRARRVIATASIGFVSALVVSQAYFQVDLQRRIDRQGTHILDVPKLSVSSVGGTPGVLRFLPFGYRLEILRALVGDLGMEAGAFVRTVHGPVLGLPEENEYLLQYLTGKLQAEGTGGRPVGGHYLVVRDWRPGSGPQALRWQRVGPYAVIQYAPAIDYQSWSYVVAPRDGLDGVAERGWRRLAFPASNVGVTLRRGEALFCKGLLRQPGIGRLAVNVIGEEPLDVVEARAGGARLSAVARRAGESPSLYWANETVFDLKHDPTAGDVPILVAIAGQGRVLSVDVREAGDP